MNYSTAVEVRAAQRAMAPMLTEIAESMRRSMSPIFTALCCHGLLGVYRPHNRKRSRHARLCHSLTILTVRSLPSERYSFTA